MKYTEWEAVVKILFVDEQRLLSAMAPFDKDLTNEERERQRRLPSQVYICIMLFLFMFVHGLLYCDLSGILMYYTVSLSFIRTCSFRLFMFAIPCTFAMFDYVCMTALLYAIMYTYFQVFSYDDSAPYTYPSPWAEKFPNIDHCCAKIQDYIDPPALPFRKVSPFSLLYSLFLCLYYDPFSSLYILYLM